MQGDLREQSCHPGEWPGTVSSATKLETGSGTQSRDFRLFFTGVREVQKDFPTPRVLTKVSVLPHRLRSGMWYIARRGYDPLGLIGVGWCMGAYTPLLGV